MIQATPEVELVRTMKEIQEGQELHIQALQTVLNEFVGAGEKFIAKVESGRAHSTETYNDLKLCVKRAKVLL